MEKGHLPLPDQRNYEHAYELAYGLAREKLTGTDDIEQLCRNSDARYQVIDSKKTIIVKYLDRPHRVTLPDVEVSLADSEEEVPLREKLLILHYLISAKGTPATNELITYKELPEGVVYFPTFSKRAIKPVVDYFGNEPHRLLDAAGVLGGRKADYGDVAVTIDAFPRVPITLVLWQGDSEFPASGSIIFDSTITDYLSTEDITVLCETIAWKLVRLLKSAGQ
jgi:hypothetical protein